MHNKLQIVAAVLATCLVGCSIGNRYGYDSSQASLRGAPTNLSSLIPHFIEKEFLHTGAQITFTDRGSNQIQVFISGLHGYIVPYSRQWERLQLFFVSSGAGIRIFSSGWSSSGINQPPDYLISNPIPDSEMSRLTNRLSTNLELFVESGGV